MSIHGPMLMTVLVSTCVALTGCGTTLLSNRETNPVLQDFVIKFWGRASTLSTTSSRRLALMVYKPDSEGREILVTCAEPPPDVGETFAKAIAAQVELSAKSPTASIGDASVKGGYASEVATAIAPLMVRTQGLQVLRDSAYTLCVDHMNGWMSDADYLKAKNDRFDKAVDLIAKELPYLPHRVEPLAKPTLPASVAASAAIPASGAR
jgi:hypothetical protein